MQALDYSHDPPRPAEPTAWHPILRELRDYYVRIAPSDRLPGRQHFRLEDVPAARPRLVMLDVYQSPLRYKYRVVGAREAALYGYDPTGRWYDEVRPRNAKTERGYVRLQQAAERGVMSYRKGPVLAIHHREHQSAENLVMPFATDGKTVDMIVVAGVISRRDGTEA